MCDALYGGLFRWKGDVRTMDIKDMTHYSEKRQAVLKSRSERCVCKFCGNPIRLKQIMFSDFKDARVELYCEHCERIEYGIEPEIYRNARYFAEAMEFNLYTELDDNERTKQMTIAKICEIMAWGDKHLGFLSETGFVVPPRVNRAESGEYVIYTEADLEADLIDGQA